MAEMTPYDPFFAGEILAPSSVAILVGPNGSGKSNYLRAIAEHHRHVRDIAIVCNTAYDRYAGLRGVLRMSVGRYELSAKSVIKRAMIDALERRGSDVYQINSVLKYCGYSGRIGFRAVRKPGWWAGAPEAYPEEQGLADKTARDFQEAIRVLDSQEPDEITWIDPTGSIFEYSRGQEFFAVLRCEAHLRRADIIQGIEVYFDREGQTIELRHASSGELSLLSSLIFLIASVPVGATVLVDEPENSLHPRWQREYVDKLLAALHYRDATVVIATHAPLIVTGALALHSGRIGIYMIDKGRPQYLDLKSENPNGIEEILWRAFEVVTPANHFVSGEIIDAIDAYERGQKTKGELLELVDQMQSQSFDQQQRGFFGKIRALIDKVEASKAGRQSDRDDEV